MDDPVPPQRTVLVTGANSGIGLATVLELARRGFPVVGTVRSDAKAAAVADAAERAAVEVATELLDVNDVEGCADVIDRVRPWAVVNNAGFGAMGAIEDVPDEQARAALETMVLAPLRLARLALPHMRAAGAGRIVNISSVYGFTSTPLTGWYQAAKHALEAASDALRMEVAQAGVQVVLVQPGAFDTGIWDDAEHRLEERSSPYYADAYARSLTLTHRWRPFMGDAEGVAATVTGALEARSPRARYLVGRDAWVVAAASAVTVSPVRDRLARLVLGL